MENSAKLLVGKSPYILGKVSSFSKTISPKLIRYIGLKFFQISEIFMFFQHFESLFF